MMEVERQRILHCVEQIPKGTKLGRILSYNGLVIEAIGPDARLGELCEIDLKSGGGLVRAEVVGFRQERPLLMPYSNVVGMSTDSRIRATGQQLKVPVGDSLLGRVVNAFCEPLDGGGALHANMSYPVYSDPINPMRRKSIDSVLETGTRVIDTMLTLGVGQRVGVMAGSGVGKSTLLGMLARRVSTDITVLALIGERGREVRDFIAESLGEEGMKRSVVIVAAADEPALVRTHATYAAHAIAEYFRDLGKSVLLIVDSITRFAMAQREIGLAVGEPPTFRGYTPSVFAKLPTLLERCGRLDGGGSISGVYSVLVEGDDMNEPVTDHMRATLDGHIVLNRELASRGHHPAIDVLQSASRLMGNVTSDEESALAAEVKERMAIYEASRDLVEMGAHQRGVNPALDSAIDVKPLIDRVMRQSPKEATSRKEALRMLADALSENSR